MLQENSTIPGLTEETAGRIVAVFFSELERAQVQNSAADLFRALESRIDEVGTKVESQPHHTVQGSFTERIDLATREMKGGRLRGAISILRSVEEEWSLQDQDDDLRYRVDANLGMALSGLGDHVEAIRRLRSAVSHRPEEARVRALLAQVLMVGGHRDEAREVAAQAVEMDAECEEAWAVRVVLDQLDAADAIPESVRSSQHVLGALGWICLTRQDGSAAEDFMREALRQGERHPRLLVGLGEAVLIQQDFVGSQDALTEAGSLADEALVAIEGSDLTELEARAHKVKGAVLARRESGEAIHHFQRAVTLDPADQNAAFMLARVLHETGDHAGASYFLSGLEPDEVGAQLHVLRAWVAAALGQADNAVEELHAATAATPDGSVRLDAAEAAIAQGHTDLAQELLDAVPDDGRFVLPLLQGRLAEALGDDDEARSRYEVAVERAPNGVRVKLAAELARLFHRLGLRDEGIELLSGVDIHSWEPALSRKTFLLYELERHAEAYELVQGVLEEGRAPPWALEVAMRVALARDDLEGAVPLLEQLVEIGDDPVGSRLTLARILLRLGRPGAARPVLRDLEEVHDLSGRQLVALAQLLAEAGVGEDALTHAWRGLRLSPGEADLKMAFITLFVRREDEADNLDRDEVVADTWVRVEKTDGNSIEYLLLSSDKPRSSREYSWDSEVAQRLAGLKVGDEAVFREGELDELTVSVVELKSALVHTFQSTLLSFTTDHPSEEGIRAFSVGEAGSPDQFAAIMAVVNRQADLAQKALDLYEERHLPLGMIANWLGRPLRRLILALRADSNRAVFVDWGSRSDQSSSLIAATTARQVVLTVSALETVQGLGLLDGLASVFDRLVAPRSLVEGLDEDAGRIREFIGRGGGQWMGADNQGLPRITEAGPEALQAEFEDIQSLLRFLRGPVEILPLPIKAIGSRAEELRASLGDDSWDAYQLAKAGGVLFADDVGLRSLVRGEADAPSFSTYQLLQVLFDRGEIDLRKLATACGTLAEWGHTYLPVSAELVVELVLAEGLAITPRVRALIDRLSPTHSDPLTSVPVAVSILRRVYESALGGAVFNDLAAALVERLSADDKGAEALRLFEALAQEAFRLLPRELDFIQDRIATQREVRGLAV